MYTHGEYFAKIDLKGINILTVSIYFREKSDIFKPDQRFGSWKGSWKIRWYGKEKWVWDLLEQELEQWAEHWQISGKSFSTVIPWEKMYWLQRVRSEPPVVPLTQKVMTTSFPTAVELLLQMDSVCWSWNRERSLSSVQSLENLLMILPQSPVFSAVIWETALRRPSRLLENVSHMVAIQERIREFITLTQKKWARSFMVQQHRFHSAWS